MTEGAGNGDKLRELREKKGLTLDQVAEMAGFGVDYIQRIEGNRLPLSVAVANALADVYGIDVSDIYTPSPRRNKKDAVRLHWAQADPKIIELNKQGWTNRQISEELDVSPNHIRYILGRAGLKPNIGTVPPPKRVGLFTDPTYSCRRRDCKYCAAKGSANGCDYIGIENSSRIKWHRQRGLSDDPADCRLYQKAEE